MHLLLAGLTLLIGLAVPGRALAYESLLKLLEEPTRLTVEVLPTSVAAVPRGATRVRLLSLQLGASCGGAVSVEEIVVHRIGLGEASDIRRVYLLQGFRPLSRGMQFSSADHLAVLRPRNLTIPSCQSVHVDIAVDYAQSVAVGSRSAVEIVSPQDVVTDAETLMGNFPMRMVVRGGPSITPDPVGQVTVTFLPLSRTIRMVQNDIFAKFRIEADNSAHQLLYGITLTNRGSARDNDLRSLYLARSGGRALTQVVKKMDGSAVTLVLSRPYFLRLGSAELFTLWGRAFGLKTVNFILEEPSDLEARSTKLRGRQLGDKVQGAGGFP